MAEEEKPSTKLVADVAHPNDTAAEPSSKPIIVTNRPIMKDTMVLDEDDSNPKLSKTRTKAVLPTDSPPPEEEEVHQVTVKVNKTPQDGQPDEKPEEKPETLKPESEPEPEAEKPEKEPQSEESAKDESENESTDNPTKVEAAEEVETAKQAEHDAAIQKMADAKQYYLPINTVEKRRSRRVVMLGIILSVLLALAWADIALDAGLVHINGVKPATHFFSS